MRDENGFTRLENGDTSCKVRAAVLTETGCMTEKRGSNCMADATKGTEG